MTQLAAISQDPWFSRVQSPDIADHVAIDLDPMPDATFARVLDVARWVRDELATLGAVGYPEDVGRRRPPHLHPAAARARRTRRASSTVRSWRRWSRRSTRRRRPWSAPSAPAGRRWCTWITCRTSKGKTLACAYSARASDYAGASTPLTWDEIDGGVDRHDFTIRTLPERLRRGWRSLGTAASIEGCEAEGRRAIRTVGGRSAASRAVRRSARRWRDGRRSAR